MYGLPRKVAATCFPLFRQSTASAAWVVPHTYFSVKRVEKFNHQARNRKDEDFIKTL